eukprot:PLAT4083.1.p1 GENE.PLAT4083.1~~PLAT4083.1.p1  ORF type:complete len:298 (-),score=70.43 PLAT4083.1:39-932(-)
MAEIGAKESDIERKAADDGGVAGAAAVEGLDAAAAASTRKDRKGGGALMPKKKGMSPESKFSYMWEGVQYGPFSQMSVEAGGVGCCVWNASVVLSRAMMRDYADLFPDAAVCELGCGACGVAGQAAMDCGAETAWFTDRVPSNLLFLATGDLLCADCTYVAYLDWSIVSGRVHALEAEAIAEIDRCGVLRPSLDELRGRFDVLLAADALTADHGIHANLVQLFGELLRPGGCVLGCTQGDWTADTLMMLKEAVEQAGLRFSGKQVNDDDALIKDLHALDSGVHRFWLWRVDKPGEGE